MKYDYNIYIYIIILCHPMSSWKNMKISTIPHSKLEIIVKIPSSIYSRMTSRHDILGMMARLGVSGTFRWVNYYVSARIWRTNMRIDMDEWDMIGLRSDCTADTGQWWRSWGRHPSEVQTRCNEYRWQGTMKALALEFDENGNLLYKFGSEAMKIV